MESFLFHVDVAARQALTSAFGDSRDPNVRWSSRPEHGDFQINVPMMLARERGDNPRVVAQRIIDHLDLSELSERAPEIAGPGFINITLSDAVLARYARNLADDPRGGVKRVANGQRIVVDYGGANIAKEMHVGHLRSTILGDSLVRTLEYLGHQIIRQDHLGDWGTQFGMLVEYMCVDGQVPQQLPDLQDLNEFYRQAKERFDNDEEFKNLSRSRVARLQGGDEESLRAWRHIYDQTTAHINEMYRRLDVLMTPDDVRGESFYNDMLEDVCQELQDKGLAVMSDGALVCYIDGMLEKDGSPFGLMIRKSDGAYGYATTDLAALKYAADVDLADRVIYAVDARQGDHFQAFFDVAKRAGWIEHTTPEHAAFGQILGEDNKPFKTRSGGTIKLGDVLDEAIERATNLVAQRTLDMSDDERVALINALGIGALKYGDLSSKRTGNYVFSWDRMLAMSGNTAPYIQYAIARVNSLTRKAEAQDLVLTPGSEFSISTKHEGNLVKVLSQFGDVLGDVESSLEPHRLCTYLFNLAQTYTSFYENCRILDVQDATTRRTRLALSSMAARTLTTGLDLLGIEAPTRL